MGPLAGSGHNLNYLRSADPLWRHFISKFRCLISPEEEGERRKISYAKLVALNPAMVISLDLRNFILRARVLKLYRQALRITQRAPGDSRAELRHTIRQEMESNRNCSDKQRIRFLISEGLERLKRLDEMLDMQGH